MITKIQLQIQSRATREYEQKVLGIYYDLGVLEAQNSASIGVIGAGAEREAATLRNEARAQGLVMLQAARANATKVVVDALELTKDEAVQYLKIQAVKAHPTAGTVVGINGIFGSAD